LVNTKYLMIKQLLFVAGLWALVSQAHSQTISQFRGPERNGIYHETGLMKSWPESGPELRWKAEGIGNGYSSPIVTKDRVYVTGEIDSTGFLQSFDNHGNLLWKKEIGREWMENFTGSRSTPTLVGDKLYLCSSMGKLSCLDSNTGNEIWSIDMLKDLNGINVRFGYSSGLLVDGDVVFCNPGGADTNIVALNRLTGKMIWKSKALGDSTAYGSPILINLPARKLIVTFTIHNMIALDATNGEFLWSQPQAADRDIQACTPVYDDGYLYSVNGSGKGAVKYEISSDGKTITPLWENPKITDVHGGFVKIGNFLYTSQYRPRRYCSIDCSNGEIADSLKFDKGAIISADGMLYCYTEKGMVGLVSQENGKMKLISSFKMPVGTKEYFTIPVIEQGILYLRHGDTLLAYAIHQ
jgi:outer membrane protein assembly factor BamB